MIRRHPFLATDGASSGGASAPQPAPTRDTQPLPPTPEKVNALVTRLLSQYGSAEAALSSLSTQLLTYQDRATIDSQTMADMRGRLPKEGEVVLSVEDAKLWAAFRDLKLTPEQIKKQGEENATLKTETAAAKTEKMARATAPALGMDPDALADLITSKGLFVEEREQEVEVERSGKKEKVKVKMPFVRSASDDKAPLEPVTEYAKKLPAFEQRALAATGTTAPGSQQQQQSSNQATPTFWPVSNGNTPTGGGSSDYAGDYLKKRNEQAGNRPNPLKPAIAPAPAQH